MGFAKVLGRDAGLTYTPELRAFELFFYWLLVGWIITFTFSMLIMPKPNFTIPILLYGFGIIFLWIKFLKADKRRKK